MTDTASDGARSVDLNSDLGESYGAWRLGDDDALLDVVTSANIACGFHAGDPLTLLGTCRSAAERGVAIGAQVGYHDLLGFGRRFIAVPPDELTAEVLYQLGALAGLARVAGSAVRYVKPHGALYNAIVTDRPQARAVARAVAEFDPTLPVLGLAGSVFFEEAHDLGVRTVAEAFADRGYTPDGTLVPRDRPGAVLHDADEIAERVVRMVRNGIVTAVDGTDVPLACESVCIHGDTPGAVAMARAVRAELGEHRVTIAPFTRS